MEGHIKRTWESDVGILWNFKIFGTTHPVFVRATIGRNNEELADGYITAIVMAASVEWIIQGGVIKYEILSFRYQVIS